MDTATGALTLFYEKPETNTGIVSTPKYANLKNQIPTLHRRRVLYENDIFAGTSLNVNFKSEKKRFMTLIVLNSVKSIIFYRFQL